MNEGTNWRGSRLQIPANTDHEIAAHQVFANRGIDATRVAARSDDIRGDGIEGILHVESSWFTFSSGDILPIPLKSTQYSTWHDPNCSKTLFMARL